MMFRIRYLCDVRSDNYPWCLYSFQKTFYLYKEINFLLETVETIIYIVTFK